MMDSKSKLPKPSGLKLPKVTNINKPLSENKQNFPTATKPELGQVPRFALSRFGCRRSKSVTDLRPLNDRIQSQRLHPKLKVEPSTSSQTRAPVKRPASQKTGDIKPKPAKQIKVKIPDWDYKTRFHHLTEKYNKTIETLNTVGSQLNEFEAMKQEIEMKTSKNLELETRVSELSQKLNELIHFERDFHDLNKRYEILQSAEREKTNRLDLLTNVESDLTELTAKFESQSKETAELRQLVINAELTRRKNHNTIQDLRGNIRVFCRVRPPISDAEFMKDQCMIQYPDESMIQIGKKKESMCSSSGGKPAETKAEFVFDRVFSPEFSQGACFEELSHLVQSALDGYDVCVFAYGQTGSGKTYTMQGDITPEHLGMIPRSMNLIFQTIESLEKTHWEYSVKVSFLEIYNDNVRDLLDPRSTKSLDICHNHGRGTTVSNLIIRQIYSPKDFDDLMTSALKHRMVAATSFNELSSRSHAVTKIYLHGVNSTAGVTYTGSVNLVDLAGSENAKNSCADRLVETKSINKSLSALGTVMLALYNKNTHVPYRNSKLTYLLQSCLGGSSKTLMIVNIPPFEEYYTETINSLRFASQVKQVKNSLKRNRAVSPKS